MGGRESISRVWLIVGWLCVGLIVLAVPLIGVGGTFALAFCDDPSAPCGALAIVFVAIFCVMLAMVVWLVVGLVGGRFGRARRVAIVTLALAIAALSLRNAVAWHSAVR